MTTKFAVTPKVVTLSAALLGSFALAAAATGQVDQEKSPPPATSQSVSSLHQSADGVFGKAPNTRRYHAEWWGNILDTEQPLGNEYQELFDRQHKAKTFDEFASCFVPEWRDSLVKKRIEIERSLLQNSDVPALRLGALITISDGGEETVYLVCARPRPKDGKPKQVTFRYCMRRTPTGLKLSPAGLFDEVGDAVIMSQWNRFGMKVESFPNDNDGDH